MGRGFSMVIKSKGLANVHVVYCPLCAIYRHFYAICDAYTIPQELQALFDSSIRSFSSHPLCIWNCSQPQKVHMIDIDANWCQWEWIRIKYSYISLLRHIFHIITQASRSQVSLADHLSISLQWTHRSLKEVGILFNPKS